MLTRSSTLARAALCAVSVALAAAACRAGRADSPVVRSVADVRLPGRATRFDYQSLDPVSGRLYISHMGDGRLVVFDTKRGRVEADLPGFPVVTGCLYVPESGRVYASATGQHAVIVVDAKTLRVMARIPGPQFPDGLAYDPLTRRLFVSDESGGKDYVIDTRTNRIVAVIALGGEAGNTQLDRVGRRIYVTVQTRNEIAAIDPVRNCIVARYLLPGSDHPHGFCIDAARRLMFVSCEGNAKLLVIDMRNMKVRASFDVGEGPDVLALDRWFRRLYVACEGGTVSVFAVENTGLRKLGDIHAPNAHTVAVDQVSHRVYLPLKNVAGHPVLRILQAVPIT